MQVDHVTFHNFITSLDRDLSEAIAETKAPLLDVRTLGQVIGAYAMIAIASSGIDGDDALPLMQELGLGIIGGVFDAGRHHPVPWQHHLSDEQAEYLESVSGVCAT